MFFFCLLFCRADVIITNDMCQCGSVNLKVDFRENQNKESMSGCIMCDDDMEALLATRYITKKKLQKIDFFFKKMHM